MSLSIVGSNSTCNVSPIFTEGSVASRTDSSADGSSNSGFIGKLHVPLKFTNCHFCIRFS